MLSAYGTLQPFSMATGLKPACRSSAIITSAP